MVAKIKLLDKKTINKIAAGEVIERPASVVKELLENAIDANSSRIIVELERAGKKLIRVTDDGSGIAAEDLKLAFEKHSTSKITTIEDVYRLRSLGFRGEALASIAAVARVECISSDGRESTGRKLNIEGGFLKSYSEIGCPKGTTIKVKDLFYNLPARAKYLKSDQTELAHIIEAITRLAIYYYKINFKLISDGNELLNLPATRNCLENLVNIYGKELVRNLVPIDYRSSFEIEDSKGAAVGREPKIQQLHSQQPRQPHSQERLGFTITGYIGKPSVTRSDTSYQCLYVNDRYVENKAISNSIKEGYRTLVMKNRYPVAILFLSIKSESVDINIHPTKLLVRFENEELVYNEVLKTIKKTLQSHSLIPEATLGSKPQAITLKAIKTLGIGKPGYPTTIPVQAAKAPAGIKRPILTQRGPQYNQSQLKTDPQKPSGTSALEFIQPIGQISGTYIIAQARDGMLIIDQHAASERIMYEKIKKRYSEASMAGQELLTPVELELSPKEQGFLKNNFQMLKELNFIIDELGENSYYVKSIPIILGLLQEPELIHDIINDLIMVTKEKEAELIKDKMIQILACKSAIKAGKTLTLPEISQLLQELYDLENPYTCAHGRPTIISMNETQLKKMFKRII